jgi:flavin-binding protein dodecin
VGGSRPQRHRDRRPGGRDLRVAEATRFDVTIEDDKIASYRVRLDISFKYESGE